MTLSLGMITVDTLDAEKLAAWWAEQTGASVVETNGGFYVVLKGGGLPALLSFQKVDDPTPGKNKVHLDLTAEGDLDEEVARLQSAGAGMVGEREEGGFRWVTLTDPDGNEFCVAARSDAQHDYS